MGLVKGLKNIKKKQEEGGKRGGGAGFLSLKDGQSVKGRFLQELDEDSPGFNEKAGIGFLAVEWRDPDNFKKRALDTSDEGKCWMAEQRAAGNNDWRPRTSLYINFLITDGDGAGEVKILNQGLGPKSVVPTLLEYADEEGTITNREWRIKRTGTGMTDTSYLLMPVGQPDSEPYDVTQHELADLENVVNDVPYEQQEAFFRGENASATADAEW